MGFGPLVPSAIGSPSTTVIGTGTGSIALRVQKSDAGTGDIEMYSNGVHRCTLRLNSSENFQIIMRDTNGTASQTMTFATSGGQLQIPSSLAVGGASGPTITSGTGSPASVVTAPVGSLYLRTDGGDGTSLYVKESGAGNTGWGAVA